jgi:uncharacterized protein with GYD domain
MKSAGGSLEAYYFAFGDDDFYIIVDMPDNETASAVSLTANATGSVKVKTIALLTPEEVDQSVKQTVEYRPPGE